MTIEEIFAAIKAGTVSLEDFDAWVSATKLDSFSEGYDEANYTNAMSN